jgi:hypothetical protein
MILVRDSNFGGYHTYIQGLLYTHFRSIITRQKLSQLPVNGKTTLFLDIDFQDESILEVVETLIEQSGTAKIVSYSYHYERQSGFFFHYEMEHEPDTTRKNKIDWDKISERIKKPCCHLHVGAQKEVADSYPNFPMALREHDGPHYGTYPVSFDYVLSVIVLNYFPECKSSLEKMRHLSKFYHHLC